MSHYQEECMPYQSSSLSGPALLRAIPCHFRRNCRCKTRGSRAARDQNCAIILECFLLQCELLRIIFRTANETNDRQLATLPPGGSLCLADSGCQHAGGIVMTAVPQNNIEDDTSYVRIKRLLQQSIYPHSVINHWMRPTDGKLVATQIDRRVFSALISVHQLPVVAEWNNRIGLNIGVSPDQLSFQAKCSTRIKAPDP